MCTKSRVIGAVLAIGLVAAAGSAWADPYFQIRSLSEWDQALATAHVVPLQPHEWDSYMQEWEMYLVEGEPYPETNFIPAMLYPYEGPEVPPHPDGDGGLVMAWGSEDLPEGSYASAWKYDYQVDPDLTNAVITLTVYPPQYGANGAITQVSFGVQDINGNTRSWFWNCGPGQPLPWNVGTPITIYPGQTGVNAVNPPATGFMNNGAFNPAMSQYFIADENGQLVGGPVPVPPPGGPPAGVWNYWYNIIVQPTSGPGNYKFEFSVDIGSDTELSDPFMDGDEGFDPGDVYWWQSSPVTPPGRDGFKDDAFIFGFDPAPDAPGGPGVPVGNGTIEDYWEYFDLDGHDQTDFTLIEAQFPLPMFDSQCVHGPQYLMISFDDDTLQGWPVNDVPVTKPSPAGVSSYGTTAGQDEIIGVNVGVGGPPPYPVNLVYPIADEATVHNSLRPNPDNTEEEDDDVDSLDIVENEDTCPYWYFSPDHEAHMGLDPGGIFEVIGGGYVQVIDEAFHLGISEETDIDAFEFTWLEDPQEPGFIGLALLYSVDEDDPLTGQDESGGLNPFAIYISWMTGYSLPFIEDVPDDIDALTIWREPIVTEEEGACCYGDTAVLCVVTTQVDCEQNLLGMWMGPGTDCTDADGNGVADICEQPEVGACCYDDYMMLCLVTTQTDCEQNYSGTWMGPGTDCTDVDGNGIADICEDPDLLGACCYDENPVLCVVTSQGYCEQILNGTWMGPGTDCTDADGNGIADICEPEPRGACCYDTYFVLCVVTTQTDCITTYGGIWHGPGTTCVDTDGNGIADLCEDPDLLGACCYEDPILCMVTSQGYCEQNLGGTWMGSGTDCTDADGNGIADICEEPGVTGACCVYDQPIVCYVVTELECLDLGGDWKGPFTSCDDYDGNGIADICEMPFRIEFSVDIGSDRELSDPFMDGDEGFDPGDVYWWRSQPVNPPGRDGFKDDLYIFTADPWPDAPDLTGTTGVPVGEGSPDMYYEFFDLDGHDQVDVSFFEWQIIPPDQPVEGRIPMFDSACIHPVKYLMVSFDDDMAPGWPVNDVPVTVPSPAGVSSYGTTGGQDEVVAVTLATVAMPPYPVQMFYPLASETDVHQSLWPNPDNAEEDDDDVDSLDVVWDREGCPYWYFTADHEANYQLDPGDIYEVTPVGAVRIIDAQIHLGLPEGVDLDAFEFAWLTDEDGTVYLVLLFSVDEDDPVTAVDESGGLPPFVVFGSFLNGYIFPVAEEFQDDIDGLTCWRENVHPVWCLGDLDCSGGSPTFADINYFVQALNGQAAWTAYYQANHGGALPPCPWLLGDFDYPHNGVDFGDILPFVSSIGQPCIPYMP